MESGKTDSAGIRGGTKERFLGLAAGWLLRIYSRFLRVSFEDRSGVLEAPLPGRGVIVAVWHNRIFLSGPTLRYLATRRRVIVLTSASKDGTILANAVRVLGAEAARGSSSRRSRAGMMNLLRRLRDDYVVVITPDGPRGPRYCLQPGVVKLAQVSGSPVVPLRIEYERAWRLKSWDRFRIPRPFSRVQVVFDPALEVPRDLDDDGFDAQRERIEAVLREGIDDLLPDHDQD